MADMTSAQPRTFRPEIGATAIPAVAFALLAALNLADGDTTLSIVFAFAVPIVIGFRSRQRLMVGPDGVSVRVFTEKLIPWQNFHSVERASLLRGGVRVDTNVGAVWSIAPCSWWGGPASPQQVDAIRQATLPFRIR